MTVIFRRVLFGRIHGLFTDNSNGTVTDNLTGLIWLKDANCFGVRPWDEGVSGEGAAWDCFYLEDGGCGLTDGSTVGEWRLPNRKELLSLIDLDYYYPALSNTAGTGQWSEYDPFTDVQSNNYWSSTTDAGSTSYAWRVYFFNGNVSLYDKGLDNYVWCVRGGN